LHSGASLPRYGLWQQSAIKPHNASIAISYRTIGLQAHNITYLLCDVFDSDDAGFRVALRVI
jgi:hypothetical protein